MAMLRIYQFFMFDYLYVDGGNGDYVLKTLDRLRNYVGLYHTMIENASCTAVTCYKVIS
jgi:hypothetical protein